MTLNSAFRGSFLAAANLLHNSNERFLNVEPLLGANLQVRDTTSEARSQLFTLGPSHIALVDQIDLIRDDDDGEAAAGARISSRDFLHTADA